MPTVAINILLSPAAIVWLIAAPAAALAELKLIVVGLADGEALKLVDGETLGDGDDEGLTLGDDDVLKLVDGEALGLALDSSP